jgi:hypothetical protein
MRYYLVMLADDGDAIAAPVDVVGASGLRMTFDVPANFDKYGHNTQADGAAALQEAIDNTDT